MSASPYRRHAPVALALLVFAVCAPAAGADETFSQVVPPGGSLTTGTSVSPDDAATLIAHGTVSHGKPVGSDLVGYLPLDARFRRALIAHHITSVRYHYQRDIRMPGGRSSKRKAADDYLESRHDSGTSCPVAG